MFLQCWERRSISSTRVQMGCWLESKLKRVLEGRESKYLQILLNWSRPSIRQGVDLFNTQVGSHSDYDAFRLTSIDDMFCHFLISKILLFRIHRCVFKSIPLHRRRCLPVSWKIKFDRSLLFCSSILFFYSLVLSSKVEMCHSPILSFWQGGFPCIRHRQQREDQRCRTPRSVR